jgi:hypothetical protein
MSLALRTPTRWRDLRVPVGSYVLSRLVSAVVIGAARLQTPGVGFDWYVASWDGAWFQRVVTEGYPAHLPVGQGNDAQATTAFLPLFPYLAHWFDVVSPFGLVRSMMVFSLALGLVAVVLWWKLMRRHFSPATADTVATVMAFFPGAYVFSMGYSEPLFLVLVAATLLALEDRHWLRAGTWCLLAGITRPNGVALMTAVAVVAVATARREHRRGPLVAVILAPIGLAVFHVFQWRRTGQWNAWWNVQHRGWYQGLDFGRTTWKVLWRAGHDPFYTFVNLSGALAAVFMIVGVVWLIRTTMPLAWKVYAAVVVVMALSSTVLLSTPRFAFTAVPLLAVYVERWGPVGRTRFVAICGGLMMWLTWLIGTGLLYIP